MAIAHLSMGFASLLVIATDADSVEELNLLSLQNRQTRKLEDSIEQESTINFCENFCGAAKAGKGCCVSKDGTSKFMASKASKREQCEKTGVWCTGGNKAFKGSDLTKTAGWSSGAETPPTVTTVAATDAVASVYTDAPHTTTMPQAGWTEYATGKKCTGKSFDISAAASQYACEQQAILATHSFYQYNARQGSCATVEACFTPTPSAGYMVYRNPALWQLNAQGQKCSNKKKHGRDGVESQLGCQVIAIAAGHNYYTWNAQKKACIISKKCKSSPAGASWVTYKSDQ